MKPTIIGTCKIDSDERLDHLIKNIQSMAPLGDNFCWRFNIIGRHTRQAVAEIEQRYSEVEITHSEDINTYELMSAQMDHIGVGDVFFWQEDHWFLAPHPDLYWLAYSAFRATHAEVFTLTHLTTSWTCKNKLPFVYDNGAAIAVRVNLETQQKVWDDHPSAYLSGTPAIYTWAMADAIMNFRKEALSQTYLPDFELSAKYGRKFLEIGVEFTEVIPRAHLFREVFIQNKHPRSVDYKNALEWLHLRDGGPMFGGGPGNYQFDGKDEAK
jgi:hypothetical protein